MTRRITLISTLLGAAVLVPAAFGKSQPVTHPPDAVERAVAAQVNGAGIDSYADAVERAVLARELSNRLSTTVSPDAFERAVASSSTSMDALQARSEALNRHYGLGVTAPQDAFERAVKASQGVSWIEAPGTRGEGLNQTYGGPASIVDSHDRIVPTSETPVSVSTSGREIDWPQLGIGFGVGLLMALGLFLAMRLARIRPVAHG